MMAAGRGRSGPAPLTRDEKLKLLRELCADAEKRGLKVFAQAWQQQVDRLEQAPELALQDADAVVDQNDELEPEDSDQLELDFGDEL